MVKFIIPKIKSKNPIAAVYKMTFDCRSFYIGSSMNIKQRMWGWKFKLESGVRKNIMVLNAFEKTKSVMFEVLEIVPDPQMVKHREDCFIKLHWSNSLLLNRSPSAFNNKGSKHSPGRRNNTAPRPNRKKIAKVNDGGEIIEVFESIKEATEKNNNISVSRCLKKYGIKANGWSFREFDKNGNIIEPPIIPRNKRKKGYRFSEIAKNRMRDAKKERIKNGTEFIPEWQAAVSQYDKNGNHVATYNSIGETCRAIGCADRRRLRKLLKGKRGKTIYGFTFKYA